MNKNINLGEVEVILANANKPISNANFTLPLNLLDDRVYEVLTYVLFKKIIDSNESEISKTHDDIILMQGVGEKGMDCALLKDGLINGVVQCKKYSKNLTENLILAEIVKFCIHAFIDKDRFDIDEDMFYYMATTTGYSGKAIELLELLNSRKFFDAPILESLVTEILSTYKSFEKITYAEVKEGVIIMMKKMYYKFLRPEDFNTWINKYPEIMDSFFEIKKVTDNKMLVEKSNEIINLIKNSNNDYTIDDVNDFKAKYKASATEKLNMVNFIGFDLHKYRQKPTDISLTELFVQPTFQQREFDNKFNKIKSVVGKDLKIANIFNSERNLIILGDPGAGKSLLVKYIIVHICNGSASKLGLRQYSDCLPVRLELRKYNEVRESKNVIDYIAELVSKEYQVTVEIELIKFIFENFASIVFFDGLDEIFNISHKNKVKECIELFSYNFPKTKCIVTSRFIGYHDIKFSSKKFDEFSIQRFDQTQINNLVNKFYTTQILNLEKKNQLVNNCIKQIDKEVDIDLKSNPLILTLILILISNNIVIPDSKLEIYEACTKTLVDSLDTKEKELKIEMPVKNKRSIFAYLAYWQYESITQNKVISFDKALKEIAGYLIKKREAKDYAEAEEKAVKFLEYAEKRSIYFEDNFTHKTFLEYYTADYLYINYFTKVSDSARTEVIGLINKYLSKSFWYIVFELLLTRVDKDQVDNELLDEVIDSNIKNNQDSLNVYYFFISNFNRFYNISDDIKKYIIFNTILTCVKGAKMTELSRVDFFEENSLLNKMHQLLDNDESYVIMQKVVYEIEEYGLGEKELIEFYNFYCEMLSLSDKFSVKNQLQLQNEEHMKELAYKDLALFSKVFLPKRGKKEVIPINVLLEQIEHFGHKSLFKAIPFRHRENVIRIDTFDVYLLSIIENMDFISIKLGYKELMEIGLRHTTVIEHVKSSRLFFVQRKEGFLKTLQLYLKSDEEKIDEILVALISTALNMKFHYDFFRSSNKNAKLKVIDKLFEKRTN